MADSEFIDVWDSLTFDRDLGAALAKETDLVRDYMTTEDRIFLSYDLGRSPERLLTRPHNPYASAFGAMRETIQWHMQSRTIRAWHYTRLTGSEVDKLRHDGIHLSTPATLRKRLDSLIMSGDLSEQHADELYSASPFHSDQLESRSDKFFLVSHPQPIDYPGVVPLIAHWGGEVASMFVKDPTLLVLLSAIGKPRVLEVIVPLAVTRSSYTAAGAVIATFGRTLGCIPSGHMFDIWVTAPLEPSAILKVHTEDEPEFQAIGRSYPEGYLNVDIGHWKELTGED